MQAELPGFADLGMEGYSQLRFDLVCFPGFILGIQPFSDINLLGALIVQKLPV